MTVSKVRPNSGPFAHSRVSSTELTANPDQHEVIYIPGKLIGGYLRDLKRLSLLSEDLIKVHRAHHLYEKYGMTCLPLALQELQSKFPEQVMNTYVCIIQGRPLLNSLANVQRQYL